MAGNEWFRTSFARLMLDGNRGEYDPRFLSKLDINKIVDQCVKTGAEVVTLMGKDISGYVIYNSKVNPKYPGFGDLDYLGEMVKRLHEKNIKVMLNYITLGDRRLWTLHPDWRQVDAEGKTRQDFFAEQQKTWPGTVRWMKFHLVCPNSPARQEIIRGIKEVVANYDIDGIWLDLPNFYIYCHCKYCQKKFRERFKAEIPEKPDDTLWRQFLKWRSECVAEYTKGIWEAAKSVRPDIIFKKNFVCTPHRVPLTAETIENGEIMDTVMNDTYNAKGAFENSRIVRFLKSATRGGLAEALYYKEGTHSQLYYTVMITLSYMLTESFTAIANGVSVALGDFMHAEGYFYDEIIDRFSEVLKQIKEREEWLIGAEPVKFAGLYFSQDTRDLYSRNLTHRYGGHFDGAFRVLLEEHIPFEIVHHRNLAKSFSEGLKVLVMPNAACLDEKLADEIREFVRGGGGLVTTYETSLYDEAGSIRGDFLLGDVLGAMYCGNTGYWQDFLELGDEHPVTNGIGREVPIQHVGPQLKVRVKPGTKVLGRVVYPYWQNDYSRYVGLQQPPGIRTELPSIIINEYGDGRVVYLPNRIDAVYAALNLTEAKRLLANAVRWAAKEQILELEAPTCIEATLYAQEEKGRTIVHLVNVQPTEDTIPVTGITAKIHVEKPVKKVYLAPDRTEPEYKVEKNIVEIQVPKVEYHRMIVIEH